MVISNQPVFLEADQGISVVCKITYQKSLYYKNHCSTETIFRTIFFHNSKIIAFWQTLFCVEVSESQHSFLPDSHPFERKKTLI